MHVDADPEHLLLADAAEAALEQQMHRRARLQITAITVIGALVLACVWLLVITARVLETGAPLPPVLPHAPTVTLIGGIITVLLVGLLLILVLEISRRTDQTVKLEREQARLAAEIGRGQLVQQRLQESEARLRDFARMASDWFWEQDAELRFTSIGSETPLLLPGDRSHIGRQRWELNDTSQDPAHWEMHRRDLMERKPFRDFRYSRMGRDGKLVHVSINGVPVYDADGSFVGYRGTGQDITREVEAEAELRLAKERAETAETLLRDAVDSISEGFVIYDRDDRLVLCNERYRKIYPESAEHMMPGAPFINLLTASLDGGDIPDAIGREAEYCAGRMRSRQTGRVDLEQRLANGRWVMITERRMRNGGIVGLRIDITALKQAQIAVAESEHRLRDYVETSSDWFWEQDADLRFTWISETCPTLKADAADYYGKLRWDLSTSDATPPELWQAHRAVLAARQPFRDFRYSLRADAGCLVHVTVSGKPVFDADGRFLGYRGTGREITAEVLAEAESRDAKTRAEQAESLLHDAVDSISEGFVIFDREDGFVMCNDTYRRLYAPAADLLKPGTQFVDIVRRVLQGGGHPDAEGEEQNWLEKRLRLHRDAQGVMEEKISDDLWILASDRRMKNGGIAGLRVNITALKQAQAALRESEARLDRAQAIAGVGGWELDLQTGRYFWSKELFRIRGLSPENFEPTVDNVAIYVHPDDYPIMRRWLAELAKGRELDTIETRIVRPDGSVRALHVEGRPVVEPDGSVRRLTGTMQDVTETRLMQQQLAQAQKMEAIGELTGGMAHDFNNVLGVVIGNLELLGKVITDNPTAEELRHEALDGARRGAELTRRLLAFARRQPLRPQQTEVNRLIEGLGRLLRRMLGEHIDLRLRLGESLPAILVDPAQLEAALANLATNARDAMPQGGRLEIGTRKVLLDDTYAAQHPDVRPGEYVLVEVSDTGMGIPKDLVDRIFQPFFTTKEPGRGSGLGLAMVFGFAKQSGGHIGVYSEDGRGTTFRVYLPARPRMEEPEPPESPAEPVRGGNETILLVEDNVALRRASARQLSALGYRIHQAESAAEAIAFLATGRSIDLLFTDVVMPGGMDGIELAQRAAEMRPGLRCLLTSGFPEARSSGRGVPVGIPLLGKPYSSDELARTIRTLLDHVALTAANA